MEKLKNFVTALHQSTKRDYLSRMIDQKVACMQKAKEYEDDYWDGDRRFGYGGYKFIEGRWKPVAEKLIENYKLTNNSKILDVGCGKGFLLYEIKKILTDIKIVGIDISKYGYENAHPSVKNNIILHRAQDKYPFIDKEFDLVISLGTLHNLRLFDLKKALSEIERVGKSGYIMLESYRNEQELFNLQCWALTCESFFDEQEWVWLYKHFGYSGDYEFIFFE
jgi:ubiquinone/menaquinone biosynthesis C-methylase UbiE